MNLPRFLLRLALGRRLPITGGELRLKGLAAPVTIRRDAWGVPHIDAETDASGRRRPRARRRRKRGRFIET